MCIYIYDGTRSKYSLRINNSVLFSIYFSINFLWLISYKKNHKQSNIINESIRGILSISGMWFIWLNQGTYKFPHIEAIWIREIKQKNHLTRLYKNILKTKLIKWARAMWYFWLLKYISQNHKKEEG